MAPADRTKRALIRHMYNELRISEAEVAEKLSYTVETIRRHIANKTGDDLGQDAEYVEKWKAGMMQKTASAPKKPTPQTGAASAPTGTTFRLPPLQMVRESASLDGTSPNTTRGPHPRIPPSPSPDPDPVPREASAADEIEDRRISPMPALSFEFNDTAVPGRAAKRLLLETASDDPVFHNQLSMIQIDKGPLPSSAFRERFQQRRLKRPRIESSKARVPNDAKKSLERRANPTSVVAGSSSISQATVQQNAASAPTRHVDGPGQDTSITAPGARGDCSYPSMSPGRRPGTSISAIGDDSRSQASTSSQQTVGDSGPSAQLLPADWSTTSLADIDPDVIRYVRSIGLPPEEYASKLVSVGLKNGSILNATRQFLSDGEKGRLEEALQKTAGMSFAESLLLMTGLRRSFDS